MKKCPLYYFDKGFFLLQLSFVNFRRGSYMLVEGKPDSDHFFIIQKGQAQCVREIDFNPTGKNNILGPGDFVGVIPCMANRNQIESVVALTDLVAISVKRSQYPELIAQNTAVALKIIRVFAARMREMNAMLLKMALKAASKSTEDQLFDVAAFYDEQRNIDIAVYAYYQYLKAQPNGEFAQKAKNRFITLQKRSKAVYLEPKAEDTQRFYPMGTMVFAENQSGQDMFIIQSGQIKITKIIDGKEVLLAMLKRGDFFGEMALLENLPRSASAIAHDDCQLMVINRKNFDQMVSTQAQMISRLTNTLAERLWSMYRQVSNTLITDNMGKLFDMLGLQIEKARIGSENATAKLSYTLNISPQELANMCAIPPSEQYTAIKNFLSNKAVRQEGNKLYVPDVVEIIKISAYSRKQKPKKAE